MIAERKNPPLRLLAALLLIAALLTACSSKEEKVQEKLEIGQKYLTEQNYTEAIASFTEAIGLDPENITAYLGRAQAYEGLKQYDDAKTDYTTAIEKADSQPYLQTMAYVGRAGVFVTTGDEAAAKADYDKAMEVLKRVDLDGKDETFRQGIQNLLDYITQELAKLDTTENGAEDTGTGSFQQIMDSIEVPAAYASCRRYVMVNDYDNDGKEEAFGYFGFYSSTEKRWEQLYLYFISSDGQVTQMYDPSIEQYEAYKLCGYPDGVDSDDPKSFSACYVTNGGQVFAKFQMEYLDPQEAAGFSAALTVLDGQPVMLDAPFDLSPAAGNFFRGNEGDDIEYVYALRDGAFQKVGEVSCAAMEGVFSDKNTPEEAWKKYESGIRQWLKQHEYGAPEDLTSRVITGDYDGDGRQEAFAILQQPENGIDVGTAWAHVYYISPDGYIFQVTDGYMSGGALYGYLRDDSPLSAGKQKFLLWELDAGGSGSSTLIFGVKDGIPYEPEVSGSYQFFQQSGSGYTGMSSDFSQGYHNYIDHSLTFDAASGEFREK